MFERDHGRHLIALMNQSSNNITPPQKMLEARWSPCPEICLISPEVLTKEFKSPILGLYVFLCCNVGDARPWNALFRYTQNFTQHVEAKRDLQFVNQLQSEWETSSETCETKSSLEASVTMEVMKHYWPANLLAAWPICTRGFSNQVADLKYENVHSVLAPSGNIPSCCTAFSTLLLWNKMRVCWYTFATIDYRRT